MPAKLFRAIGLMSGTSLDGVDAAWLETDGLTITSFGPTATLLYQDDLRADLRRLLDLAPHLSPDDPFLHTVEDRLTRDHAVAVSMTGRAADLIGFHGQTILHAPERHLTWQIGNAPLLARITRIPVVHDFRSNDVAHGGEGAPLVPLFHAALAAALPKPLLIANIGGVANITWLGAAGEIIALDTGPGNGPLDDLAQRHLGTAFDENGAFAASGQVDEARLRILLTDPFFARPAPKSLDRLSFQTLIARATSGLAPADAAATLAAFTAAAIKAAPVPEAPTRVLVTGGGRHNRTIIAELAKRFPVPVQPVEAVGWNGDALEAQCFAYLAVRSLRGLPLSLPTTTGVPTPLTGGRLAKPAPLTS
jgi:anhydro-N-acetylmuramic acid kinase